MSPVGVPVRGYQPGDLAAVYDICVRTGDNGEDATGKFEDVRLLADIYAGPYLYLEPDLSFVLDDGDKPVGYVIGTADTASSFTLTVRPLSSGCTARSGSPASPTPTRDRPWPRPPRTNGSWPRCTSRNACSGPS